jgi:hypothetical protein
MGRKRIAETQPQAVPEQKKAPQETVASKAEAVRILLGEGVQDADAAVPAIKARFGLDVTRQQFSTYKSIEKSKGKGKKRGRKPRTAEPVTTTAPASARTASSKVSMVDDLAAVKHLVERLGAEQVIRVVKLFA